MARSFEPIGFGENGRKKVSEIKTAKRQENAFHLAMSSLQHQQPHQKTSDRHSDVSGNSKNFHGDGNSGKFRGNVAEVHDKPGDHHEKSRAKTKFLAYQV